MQMLQDLLDKLQALSGNMIYYGIAVIVILVVLGLGIQTFKEFLRRRRRGSVSEERDLSVDISTLPAIPMPKSGPVLEFYNWPVRLALIIIAPAGTGSVTPSADRWNDAFDSIVPGLSKVVNSHRPTIRTWPVQLSTSGFASRFFQYVPLPGDRGKGTRYSSIAGCFNMENRGMLVGLVFETEEPDRHGQYTVTDPSEWLGILRVKEG